MTTNFPEPDRNQETIILLATKQMRRGPNSPLARLVRQFEPYWQLRKPAPLIYASEGSYRELLRCGLLVSYKFFYPLPAGIRGGLVYASSIVIKYKLKDEYPVSVFYLINPTDPTSVYPETAALKRDAVVAGKTFLATEAGIQEWLTIQLYSDVVFRQSKSRRRFWLSRADIASFFNSKKFPLPRLNIALVAHDKKKDECLEFCLNHFDLLQTRYAERYATGTTGSLLNGEKPVWQSNVKIGEDEKKKIEKLAEKFRSKLGGKSWVSPQSSGPHGGDTQIARKILDRDCKTVMFFEDPHYAREHESDIQLLERTSRIPDLGVLCIHDKRSAESWATNWEFCLKNKFDAPMTLVQAYRVLFNVELVLAQPGENDKGYSNHPEANWHAILDTAAFYITSAVAARCSELREFGRRVSVGVPWGHSTYELCEHIESLPKKLKFLDRIMNKRIHSLYSSGDDILERGRNLSPYLINISLTSPSYIKHENVEMVPVVGVMGAYDRDMEANQHATRLADLMGGDTYKFSDYAFYREADGRKRRERDIDDKWNNLDFLIITGNKPKRRFGWKAIAEVPDELYAKVNNSEGEYTGLYLTKQGEPWPTDEFQRQGISHEQIKNCANRGGCILIAGAQYNRLRVAKAMLKGGLVSIFITNIDFAWRLFNEVIKENYVRS